MDSGSESAFIGSWSSSSSSSFLNTSFESELDSNDADLETDDFIAQLTRQMADYMLQDNDDDTTGDENQSTKHSSLHNRNFQEPVLNNNHEQTRRSYADTVKKSLAGVQSEQKVTGNEQTQIQLQSQLQPPIQMYQVENQPRVGGRGRKGKMNESTQQQVKTHRHEQMQSNRSFRGSKEFVNGGIGYGSLPVVGSGMRAIFLGGSGSRNVMSGTGVFLPRSSTDATDHSRKKPGCSTVLVPTRVLQALEQHFNNIDSLSPTKNLAPTHNIVNKEKTKMTQDQLESVDHQDSKLPQDWIY
ncbi:hypothetical protein QVD17_00605 [Tagetes erecta]|uniref:Uncharacterized protein n=1 Tax=Tagetes erecta TaxID=13708 RepID=A0AAD8P7J4_TARER|nr:hypothetical protein QVD17_00605 [Tagetes erecta]